MPNLEDFVICFWEMQALSQQEKTVGNIIITDGCIDLVANGDGKQIGFAGMSRTNFNFSINLPCHSFGVRLKPGAFYALTGVPASDVMDSFLPITDMDKSFDANYFFSLTPAESKEFFVKYIEKLVQGKRSDEFVSLFDKLSTDIPLSAAELYKKLNFSARQTQRLFSDHFGLTPQMVLCILRFQKCLEILLSGKAKPNDLLNLANYYDQAHFINDFKRNIGLTPFELIRRYK